MSDLIKPLAGINRGFALVGLRPRQPPKLVSRLFTNGQNASGLIPPSWCQWILLEALGGGGTTNTDGSSGGGHAADRIIKKTPTLKISITTSGYNQIAQVNDTDTGIGLVHGYNGGTVNPAPFARYLGGAFTGNRPPEYGALDDLQALTPTSYYASYGIAGAGRLAGRLGNISSPPAQPGIGCSRLGNLVGGSAVCLTFAEEKQQLIEFLNQHYKDGWGIDWRDLPTPAYHLHSSMSPWLGAWWS